jgi:opacity protein-like surface antigen
MQRIFLLVLFALLQAGFVASAAQGEETNLKEVTLGAKAGTIGFFSGAAEDLDIDSAPYLGLEAFWRISDHLHLGGEIGYARSRGSIPLVKTELTYVPIELNLKSAAPLTPWLDFILGGGVSYNYVRFEADCLGTCFAAEEDWHPGLQLFGGVQYNAAHITLGVEGKVQVSEEEDLDNWRLTAQAGYRF